MISPTMWAEDCIKDGRLATYFSVNCPVVFSSKSQIYILIYTYSMRLLAMFKRPVKELMDSIIAQVSRGCIHIINHTKSWVQDDIKMAGYYFPVLWKEVKSRSITTQRKNGGDIQPPCLVKRIYFMAKRPFFAGPAREMSSEQDEPILSLGPG